MSKNSRNNPFLGNTVPSHLDQTLPLLTLWEWDLQGLVPGGKRLGFKACASRPTLFRPLLSALWTLKVACPIPKHYESARQGRDSFARFARFLDEHPDQILISLSQLTRELLIDFRSWLKDHFGSSTARKTYSSFASLLTHLQSAKSSVPGSVPRDLEVPTRSLGYCDSEGTVQPYTLDEQTTIESACKKEINEIIERLQQGKKLLAEGLDPRTVGHLVQPWNKKSCFTTGWDSRANILWFIVNVHGGLPPSRSHPDAKADPLKSYFGGKGGGRTHAQFSGYSEAMSYLYPSVSDLVPFIVLFAIKTGLNADSILGLKRRCLLSSSGTKTALQFTKERGSHDLLVRQFSHKGASSPIGLLKLVLSITAPLVPLALVEENDFVWLASQKDGSNSVYSRKVSQIGYGNLLYAINGRGVDSCGFTERNNLRDQFDNLIEFGFLQARKTEGTNQYLKSGNLANVSKRTLKHHGRSGLNTTAFHYLTNDATHHIHNQAVRHAQDKLVDEATGAVVIDANSVTKHEVEALAKQLGESEDKIISLLNGEQDVFIAACKDFYNKPNGKPNTPCDDPWTCFGCENALWTSRILPRLIKFQMFMDEQRTLMSPDDWSRKFTIPYRSIANEILPRFDTRTIEWAKIDARDTPFYVPPHLRNA